MTRETLAFADALNFARNVAASYVDNTGATQSAAANVARFDHDPTSHAVLGLMVQGAPEIAAPDLVSVKDATWVTAGRRTVLHQYLDPLGGLHRDCHFADDPVGAIRACLAMKATHQFVGSLTTLPTDLADVVVGDAPNLVRDGDAVTWQGAPAQIALPTDVWTVQSAGRVTEAGDPRLTEAGDSRLTGDDA